MNQTLTELANAWRNGELSKTSTAVEKRRDVVYGRNSSSATIEAATGVSVGALSLPLSFEKAHQKMLNGDLAVSVASGADAQALETIQPGRYGRIVGVKFAVVTFSDTSHTYCGESFASATKGVYKILARSGYDGQKAVCALKFVGGTFNAQVYVDANVIDGSLLTLDFYLR